MSQWRRALVVTALATGACSDPAGVDGTQILEPLENLRGGLVFATRAIQGSAGYDLYYTPIPDAVVIGAQPAVRLTEADGNEWQPSVSPGGNGLAFARDDDGIYFISPNGRIKRISDTNGTNFADSLPAVSFDGKLIAWVREDLSKPIGDTGFSQAFIMTANADGTNVEALLPKEGIVQDTPKFEPLERSYRIAWSEFDARSLTASGPSIYGIWIHDPIAKMGSYVCQAPGVVVANIGFRCFGQHLAWPVPEVIILPQNGLELSLNPAIAHDNVQGRLIDGIQNQNIGIPVRDLIPGFFSTFPVSANYLRNELMVFDGIVTSVEGEFPTLAFFLATPDGSAVRRVVVNGLSFDYDPNSTVGFFFSVATPQIIP